MCIFVVNRHKDVGYEPGYSLYFFFKGGLSILCLSTSILCQYQYRPSSRIAIMKKRCPRSNLDVRHQIDGFESGLPRFQRSPYCPRKAWPINQSEPPVCAKQRPVVDHFISRSKKRLMFSQSLVRLQIKLCKAWSVIDSSSTGSISAYKHIRLQAYPPTLTDSVVSSQDFPFGIPRPWPSFRHTADGGHTTHQTSWRDARVSAWLQDPLVVSSQGLETEKAFMYKDGS